MTSCAEDVLTILEAGTWTLYTTCPKIVIEKKESKRGSVNESIVLIDVNETPVHAYNNVKIYIGQKSCEIELWFKNSTDRDNVFSDVETIFGVSTKKPYVKNIRYSHFKNREIKKGIIILYD